MAHLSKLPKVKRLGVAGNWAFLVMLQEYILAFALVQVDADLLADLLEAGRRP